MRLIHSIFKSLKSGLYGFLLFSAFVFSYGVIALAVESSLPDNFYVEYDGVSAYSKYNVGEPPKFFSDSRYPRGGVVTWLDVLRCDTNGDGRFDFFSSHKSSIAVKPRNEPLKDNAWFYQGNVPTTYSACFVESNISVLTPHGARKEDDIKTDIFYFVEKETDIIQPV